MSTVFSYHFPNAFYWIQLRTIWWQEKEFNSLSIFIKPWFENQRMVISRVIQDDDKSFLFTASLYKHFNELSESLSIKDRRYQIYQLA